MVIDGMALTPSLISFMLPLHFVNAFTLAISIFIPRFVHFVFIRQDVRKLSFFDLKLFCEYTNSYVLTEVENFNFFL